MMRNTNVRGGSADMALAVAKDTRVELRTSTDNKDKLRAASSLAGVDLSAFILMAAMEKAQELLDKQVMRTLSADAWERMIAALNSQPVDKDDDLVLLLKGPTNYVYR
ncbi:DUF1778 domain-containing protein [Cedecea neteri]|uniref:type II toxin-antitoxin system TacA family antitoxin n=1 Tax=Cedecea neteri TaxID=158822 RepID=UPI0028932F44|nr:DUF1778 domain-containing protein [Cedecea neteri]WNJ80498.1 DUF1778 domain-containing protein [Cedecea neteri]